MMEITMNPLREDESAFYDDLNAPETFGFIINPKGCVIMNLESLLFIANDETREKLKEYITVEEENDGK